MNADYITPEKAGVLRLNNHKSLCFVHINARSARNKEDEKLALRANVGLIQMF